MPTRYDADTWKRMTRPLGDWDASFQSGKWDYLDSLPELPRYAVIAGYIHRLKSEAVVIDGGCGEGHLVRFLDPARVNYYGFDLSATAIDRARRRWGSGSFEIADTESYRPIACDVVVFNEVLPHIPDPMAVLDKFMAALNPGGIAIVSSFQNPNPQANARVFTAFLEAEIAAGRYAHIARTSVSTGRSWLVDVLCRPGESPA